MKKRYRFLSIISIFLIISLLVFPVSANTEPTQPIVDASQDQTTYGCYSADAQDAFLGTSQIVKNAKSVFLYELNTKTLMYALEPDQPLSPSSFVKILTAIVAIENGDLDSAVTVTESALADLPKSAVSVDLVENEVLTLKDLLYCMLVGSANDAAAVIAQYIGGSQVRFAEMMNTYAEKIGCNGSRFTNPHGLHDPMQLTTARDAAKILEFAMGNEVFRTIFCSAEYTVPATNKSADRYLITGNYMMSTDEIEIYFDERVIGGRTGVANDGTRCLATVARVGTMDLLCVVMGAESVYEEGGNRIRSYGGYNETKALLDTGFTGYRATQILFDGQALIQFNIENSDCLLSAGPHTTISTVLPETVAVSDLSFRYSEDGKLRAPIKQGEKVSSVEVWYNGILLAATDLFAMNDVYDLSPISQDIVKTASVWPAVIVLLVCGGLGGIVFFMYRTGRIRHIFVRIRRARTKKNRRNPNG